MATVTKRGQYQWQAKVRRRGHACVSKTFIKKSDALRWARHIESDMDRGIYLSQTEAENTTLKEALQRYLKEVTPSKRGADQEATRIRKWMEHPLALKSLASLRSTDFATYRDKRLKQVKGNTIRLELAVISHLFRIANTEWGMESLRNPTKNIRKPKLPSRNHRRLEIGEEKKLLSNADDLMKNIISVAIDTAMRRSEIARLRWEHIDFKKKTIRIPETKNEEPREIPIAPRVQKMLKKLTRHINGTVFGTPTYVKNYISKHFPLICQEANITELTFHRLRHEATSRFFEMGFNPMEVASITGHKTLAMLRHYTHLKAEDLVDRLQ